MILGDPQGSPIHITKTMTLNIASDLKTRQIVWVRNSVKIHSANAITWAALGRQNKI